MNKRLLVILGVFAGGFGLGYALTWFLVSNPEPAGPSPGRAPLAAVGDDTIPATTVAPAPGSDGRVAGTTTTSPGALEAGADDGADDAPGIDGAAPGAAADDAEAGRAGDPAPDNDGGKDPSGAALADEAPAVGPAAGGDAAAEVDPPTPAAPTGPWWERCKGRTCAMDFGRVSGAVTVRKGEIEHGVDVVWRDSFAEAERIGSLPAKDGLLVELRGVGMQHKLPVAAWIRWHDGARELTGVIALNIGDKVIKMVSPTP